MASELAKRIYQLEWNQIDVIDAELQEMRDVLEITARRKIEGVGLCWCKSYLPTLGHREDCQRARALWARLEVK